MVSAQDQARFVGRADELEVLETTLGEVRRGEPRVLLVSGEAGVGKSTLLRRFAADVADVRVLAGSCLPLSDHGIPFSPLFDMVGSLAPARRDNRADVTEDRTPHDSSRGEQVQSRIDRFRALLAAVDDAAASTTIVLVVEDVHWADPSTRDQLTYLVSNLRHQKCLVVLSYRTEDLRRENLLRSWLAELTRCSLTVPLVLEGFGVATVSAQIGSLTGRVPPAATARRLTERTSGNPYFVSELVAGGYLDGRELPSTLRELLLTRAGVVSSATLRTLHVLSLAEDELTDEALAKVAGLPISQLRDAVREAVDARLLVPTAKGVRFAHALMREALADDLLPGERAQYHEAIAGAIVIARDLSCHERATALAQLAHHREASGDVAGAVTAWIEAAGAAEQVSAFTEAHHQLSRVLAHWEIVDALQLGESFGQSDVMARAAEDAFLGGDAEAAVTLVEQAIDLCDIASEPQRAGVLKERLARYLRDTPNHARSLDECLSALALVPDHPSSVARARVLAGAAGHFMVLGRHREAKELAAAGVDMARRVGSPAVEADALNTLGYIVTSAQSVESGLTLIARAAERALAAGDAHQQMRALWNTFCSLLEAAEWQRALDAFSRADAELPRLGQDHLLPELWGYAVEVLWRTGRWQEAQDRLVEARRRFTTSDRWATNIDLLIGLGRFDEARREIEAAIERNVYTDFESQGWLRISRATIEAWEGHSEAARRDVDAALADLVALDLPLATANAVTLGLRVEADTAANARLRGAASDELTAISRSDDLSEVMGELMGRPGPADGWKRESGAMAIQCEAELTRVRGCSDPRAWERSVVAWDELSMPYHAAYSRLRAAEAHVSVPSDRPRATVLLDEALSAATALGAEPLRQAIGILALRARIDVGGFDTDVDASIGLTSRELEVLRLLAGGATNRQIATSLYISDKTASVHVSNIIRKLGVSNRSEATATAIRRGLA